MGITLNGTNQYLQIDSGLGIDYPFTIAAWVKTTDDASGGAFCWSGDKDDATTFDVGWLRGDQTGDPVWATSFAGSNSSAESSSGYSADGSWQHVCVVFAASNDRRVYLDGGSKGTNTGSRSISAAARDRFAIGRAADSTPGAYLDGSVAHVTIWESALTDENVAALAAGADPTGVSVGTLLENWPLADNTDLTGTLNSTVLTAFNSPTSSGDDPLGSVLTISSPTAGFYGVDWDGGFTLSISGSSSADDDEPVEADFNGQGYSTIGTMSGGSYSGTLDVAGGQGTLTVRLANDTGVSATVDLSIGIVGLGTGQSNVEGRCTNNQSYTHASLTAYMKREGEAITEMSDPTDSDSTDGSFWPLFTTLLMAETGLPFLYISAADGSTGLVDDNDWEKNGTGGTGNGASYTNAVNQVTASGVNRVHFIFWGAGNQDATNAVSQANYNAGLDGLIANFRGEGGALAEAIMVAWQMGDTTVADANVNAIRAATAEAWEDNQYIYPGPVLYPVDLGDAGGDGLHFKTDAEALTLAQQSWNSVSYALNATFTGGSLFEGNSKRGPKFVSARENVDRDEITVTFDQTLRTGTTLATTGWIVRDDGTPVTITSCTVSGNKVIIALDSALTGSTTTVTLGSGDDAVGTVVPESTAVSLPTTGSIYLPVEPFVSQSVSVFVVSSGVRSSVGLNVSLSL